MSEQKAYDVNIEVAHFDPLSARHLDVIDKSLEVFEHYKKSCEERRESISLSILVDDKDIQTEGAVKIIRENKRIQNYALSYPFYIGIESELVVYRKQLYRLIEDKSRSKITKKIEGYYNSKSRIACSHDIALWHLLRLGYISPVQSLGLREWTAGSLTKSHGIPFPARRVASILSDDDFGAEERAQEEILELTSFASELRGRIDRVFFSTR